MAFGRERSGGRTGGGARRVFGILPGPFERALDHRTRPLAEALPGLVRSATGFAQDLVDEAARRLRRRIAGSGAGAGVFGAHGSAARGQQHCGSEKDGDIAKADRGHRGASTDELLACFQWVHNKQQLRLRHSR